MIILNFIENYRFEQLIIIYNIYREDEITFLPPSIE